MNLVGKIFVVLVFVMSLVFVTMTMLVFQTQTVWRDTVIRTDTEGGTKELGLRQQLANEKVVVDQLKIDKAGLETKVNKERARHVQALASLETEKFDREKTIVALQTRLVGIEAERRKALGEIDLLTTVIADLQAEVDGRGEKAGLRVMIAQARKQRDQLYDKALALNDDLNQATGDVWRLNETKKTLQQQLTKALAVLSDRGLNINSPRLDTPPPTLNGLVAKVNKSGELVEVTVGYDDGLRKHHTMEIFSDKRYLGRMTVLETKPDSAVGRVENPNGRIQRGDRVATKLKG